MSGTHVIIITHTARHLSGTLLGAACQTERPRSVTVSCDGDDPAVAAAVEQAARTLGMPILLVQRAHMGASRSSQARNNAVRALLGLSAGSEGDSQGERREGEDRQGLPDHTRRNSEKPPARPEPDDRLWFLDGDCCPAPEAQAMHLSLGRDGGLVVGFRVDLTAEQTGAMSEELMRRGLWPVRPTKDQLGLLRWRHKRYVRAALLRRIGLGKAHKPKLLSANFSLTLGDYLRVNGFDEEYTGYGQEDDDLGRRLYAAGVRPVVGVATAVTFHQHHPTRAPGAWEASPNAARFGRPYRIRCERGVENPLEQAEVVTRLYTGAVGAEVN